MLASVVQVVKGFLDDVVLDNVSLDIKENDRIGLLGVNAAGKTTLLNIISGNMEPDSGSVIRTRGLEIGYLRQNDALDGSLTLEQEAREAFSGVYKIQQEMQEIAKKLESTPDDSKLLAQYDRLTARFEAVDGYALDQKITRVLGGLGFAEFDRQTRVNTMSGGEKMRFAIAKMLLRQPDLLILDEPTNHLDFEMLAWLEGYLDEYKGAVLVVSHDRYFLDTVAKDICEIEYGKLTRYAGGYSSFVVQKAERLRTANRAYEKQQIEIAHMEEYVRKNLARSASASSVGSRVKMLEKMERLERPRPEPKTISLRFDYDVEPFSTILTCESLSVRVGADEPGGGLLLYSGINLEVHRGEKVALVGLNGVGKSTFLKAVQDIIPHTGRIKWGGNVRIGYFDQELAGLDMELTAMEAVHSRFPKKTEYEIRSALGRMLLEGDDAFKKVKELSGAGRAKIAFAILVMQRANVLILDEPTNHLDYRAKEVLEGALRNFTGTLIAVSHDRYFLRRVPSKILELKPGGFDIYDGNYDYYLEKKTGHTAAVPNIRSVQKEEKTKSKGAGNYRSKEERARQAQHRNRISALEKQIEQLEEDIALHEARLADPETATNFELLSELSEQLHKDSEQLDAVMEEWLELTSQQE